MTAPKSAAPTFCEDCQHHRETRVPWNDYCVMHPRLAGFDFVRHSQWGDAPFLLCKNVNGGSCPLYQQKTGEDT